MLTDQRMRVHGCDFLLQKNTGNGWSIFVRKSLDGERVKVGEARSARNAESFALSWASIEQINAKRGRPSQLAKSQQRPRVRIEEE